MLPSALLTAALRAALDEGPVRAVTPLGERVARVETARGRYVAKWGADEAPLRAEGEGLALLRRAESGLRVPAPLARVADAGGAMLLTEWLDRERPTERHAEALGVGLAALHRHLGERYGAERDNFIGATPQRNGWDDDWPRFFGERRLGAMAERLAAAGRWSAGRGRALARLIAALPTLLPAEPPPSLLHGDLWGGNWLPVAEGAALIDPAPSFGDREADLAMTRLFGGFPPPFYAAYDEAWPLDPGAAARVPIYNLYHLLNHLLLFGESYGAALDEVLRPFARH